MKGNANPPAWIDALVDALAPNNLAEEIRGDLYELFLNDREEKGTQYARRKYVLNGLGFLARRFFWKRSNHHQPNPSVMLSSYFKMATRSLKAHRGTSVINILGLVIGIAAALVLFAVIRFELSFDTFHSNIDRIYRVVRVSGSDMSEFRTGVSYPVPVAMKEEIPGLENISSIEYFGGANVDVLDATGSTLKKFREESGCALVDSRFFEIFDFKDTHFKWLAGRPDKALVEPFSVVLTRTFAKKYFGNTNALGQTLRFQRRWDCKVTGIIEDLPPNSDFPLSILISYSSLNTIAGNDRLNNWSSVNDTHNTFVLLKEGITKSAMEEQIAKVHAGHTPSELHEFRHYLLQDLKDLHYDEKFGNFNGRTISRPTVLALGLVAIFLLLTGSINYINLATAQSTMRAKEIGLRKVMGSNRRNLMAQFLLETSIIVCIAGVIALGLAEVLLFNLQSLLNIKWTPFNYADPFMLLCVVGIIVMVALLSGCYPAVLISRFHPVAALKNRFSTDRIGRISLRKILVVVQFTITQILVVGTFIVVSQMRFFQNVDMGFNKEAILTARVPDRDEGRRKTLENQLRSKAFVSNVSFSYTLPSGINRNRSYEDIGRLEANALTDYAIFEYEAIDPAYLSLYQIKLLAGRNLDESDSVGNILINKTLATKLQLGAPAEAIGKELKMAGGRKVTVVGIVDDFYSNSMKEGVDHIVMLIDPRSYATLSIKLTPGNSGESIQEAIHGIEEMWTATYPEYIFSYQFFDENIKAFYAQESKYAQLFQIFSLIFLLIGSLGLFGLISFVVNRKGKEVAVRKVLGASFADIVFMFSTEYVRLIFISFSLAVPVTYYAVDSWLSNFAQHIPLQWWLFVLPGVSVLVLALFVVSTKSFRTANANPIDRLKYE